MKTGRHSGILLNVIRKRFLVMDSSLRKITISSWSLWGSQAVLGGAFLGLGYALWTGQVPTSSLPALFADPDSTRMFVAGCSYYFGAIGILGFLLYFPMVLKQLSKARENLPKKRWTKAQLTYTSPFPICLVRKLNDSGEVVGEVSAVVLYCTNPWKPMIKAALQPAGSAADTVEVMFDELSKSLVLVNQDNELQLVIVNLPAPFSHLIQTLNGSMLEAAKKTRS